MKKRILAFLLVLTVFLAIIPLSASADNGATITAQNTTGTAGGYAYVYLQAENLSNLAAVDLELYYDNSVMSVHYTSNGSLFSGSTVSVNTSTAGAIKISAISANGITTGTSVYANRLMTICFKLNSDCPAGEYPVKVTVGDAYDGDLSPVAISGVDGKITASAAAATKFTLYGYGSSSPLKEGDIWSWQINHSTSQTFASADFRIEYDHELFEIESIELHNNLKVEGAVYSVNTSIQGLAVISYASTKPISSYYLFTVNLKVINNTDTTATITAEASDVYNGEMVAYAPYTLTKTLTLEKKSEEIDYPNLWLESGMFCVGEESISTLKLEANAGVAAADFIITYDPEVLKCINVKAADGITALGGLIFINPNFSSGTIKFSYVNEKAYSDTDLALIDITWIPLSSSTEHFNIILYGSNVVNTIYENINLEYVTETECIYIKTVTEPTCTEYGFSTFSCACGESYNIDFVEPLGHCYNNNEFICDTCGEINYPYGDINGDFHINIIDLVRLKKIVIGIAESDGYSADLDDSGDITAIDLTILRKLLFTSF